MRKSYLFLIAFIGVSVYAYYFTGCGGTPYEDTKPKFYKIGEIIIDDLICGGSSEFFTYNQRIAENNPVTVVVTNTGYCTIKLITEQPGGTGRVERIAVYPDKSFYQEIPQKTGIVTFDILADGPMTFSYECESRREAPCTGKIEVYENFDIDNPDKLRITDSITASVSIASAHGCGSYDKYIFHYINTSSQTQRLKLEAVTNNRGFPERVPTLLPFPYPEWYGYVCDMRFWGFTVPPTGTVMDTIFANGTPSKTNVDITGRRIFYLKASCLQNPEFPDTTGNLCKGDVKITLEQ